MDTARWPQEIVVKPMEEILIPISNNNTPCSNSKENNGNSNTSSLEKRVRPQKTQAVSCPRCNSTNTKFCYYNNYSSSQPRYFCKTCRRYWTEGGSLRNIPVGGGSRKNNKKISSSNVSSSSSNSSKKQTPTSTTTSAHDQKPNPKMHDQGQDLNLGCFPMTKHDFKTISELIQVPDFENSGNKSHFSALEFLNGVSSRGCGNSNNSSYMPSMYSEGFSSLPTLGFSLDGIGNSGYGSVQGVEESGNSGRTLFPFEDLKQVSSTNDHNNNNNNMEVNNRDQQGDSTGYWNGIFGGGGSW